jgi:hypothetical protein
MQPIADGNIQKEIASIPIRHGFLKESSVGIHKVFALY